jgi:hypothetical protein
LKSKETHPEHSLRPGTDHRQKSSFVVRKSSKIVIFPGMRRILKPKHPRKPAATARRARIFSLVETFL